jgi:phospholipase/carboxylesterase
MSDSSIVVARPQAPARLVLLFHGVGSSAANLVPLAEVVAKHCPDAMVVSVDGPHPSTLGSGREWFSVVGVTEQDRPARVARALPLFHETISRWQLASGVAPAHTTLVGFSQGAIMALESTQDGRAALASRVISLAGRFAVPPRRAAPGVRFHFVHGAADGVIPPQFSGDGARRLRELGASATIDLVPGLGHGIDARVAGLVLGHLA